MIFSTRIFVPGILQMFFILWIPFIAWGQMDTSSLKEHLSSAEKLLNKKKPEEALALLKPYENVKDSIAKADHIALYRLLGQCHSQIHEYSNAVADYEKALIYAEGNDTLLASFHYEMGLSQYRLSEYVNATNHIILARNLCRQVYGVNDKHYSSTLNTLGFLYNIQAKYTEAEKIFQEARQISLRLNGGEDIQYSRIINNLANVYCNLNRYEKADDLYKTSLRIKEKISGKISKDYANTLYNLADFHSGLGRYEKAKATIQEGINILDSLKETKHPDYLKFIDHLAFLTEKTGDSMQAEKLYKEALHRREISSLTESDDYALNLMNLGHIYFVQQKFDQAFPYVEKAAILIAKIFGKNHPTYAKDLNTLAIIQSKRNDDESALHNFTEAIRIIQSSLGTEHIESFNAQFSYAQFLRKTGKEREAIELFKKIDKIPQVYLKRATRFLSEKELSEKVEEYKNYIHEIYSFLREIPNDPDLSSMAYNISLYYRGFILNSMQRIRLSMSKAQRLNDARDEIISLHRQLENELNRPLAERANTVEIEKHISEMESEVANKIGSFSEDENILNWEDVRMALGEGEAAIEYINFPDSRAGDSIYYGALLLRNGLAGPIFVDICRGVDLSSFLQLNPGRTSDYIGMIYDFANRGATVIDEKKRSLFDLVWQPLQSHLKGIKKLYLVPDGLLNRIAFCAIPTSLETVLADSIEFVYLSSSRQVVPNDNRILAYSGKRTLVVGGVIYNSDTSDIVANRSMTIAHSGETRRQWQYLPWAAKETQVVTDFMKVSGFKVSYLKGIVATGKTVIDSLESREGFRILHFATHGYFASGTTNEQVSNISFYGSGMMNSALVFAGANKPKNGNATGELEDGLLTAYAISKLDLTQTELVVLSACETALGDLKEVEGVYGMQRAFKLAGANQLIMSLWQIPDRETKDFMISFYKNWISDKSTIRESFYKTQNEFRKRFVNPYQWAGFVLLE